MSEKFLKLKISLRKTLLVQTKDVEQTIFLTKERISRQVSSQQKNGKLFSR